jgi:hypothetical protein
MHFRFYNNTKDLVAIVGSNDDLIHRLQWCSISGHQQNDRLDSNPGIKNFFNFFDSRWRPTDGTISMSEKHAKYHVSSKSKHLKYSRRSQAAKSLSFSLSVFFVRSNKVTVFFFVLVPAFRVHFERSNDLFKGS